MAADDTYIRAKKDKPGHCCACGCMHGNFCTRWWVISAIEIESCGWLLLEDGVMIKFDAPFSRLFRGLYFWRRLQFTPTLQSFQVSRNSTPAANNWNININIAGCVVAIVHPQPEDEKLLTEIVTDDISFFGT